MSRRTELDMTHYVNISVSVADAALILDALTDYEAALDDAIAGEGGNGKPLESAAWLVKKRTELLSEQLRTSLP